MRETRTASGEDYVRVDRGGTIFVAACIGRPGAAGAINVKFDCSTGIGAPISPILARSAALELPVLTASSSPISPR